MKRIDAEPIIDRLEALGHDLQHSNPEAAHAYFEAAWMLNGAPRIVYDAEGRHCGECSKFRPIRNERTEHVLYGDCLEGRTQRRPCTRSCTSFVPAHYTRLDKLQDMTVDEFAAWAAQGCQDVHYWKQWAETEIEYGRK